MELFLEKNEARRREITGTKLRDLVLLKNEHIERIGDRIYAVEFFIEP